MTESGITCQCDAPRCEREGCQDRPTPTEKKLREALRWEAAKRFYHKDGSKPDDEWLDAYIAKEYPAL